MWRRFWRCIGSKEKQIYAQTEDVAPAFFPSEEQKAQANVKDDAKREDQRIQKDNGIVVASKPP